MATIPDSVKAQLDADWTGAGGAEPTYYVHEDYRSTPPLGEDAIWILTGPDHFKTRIEPVNDDFSNRLHTLDIVVNTATSEDRLKEIGDEVVRILNATAITDITYQRVLDRKNISTRKTFNYQEMITYDLREQMASSAAAYGAGASGNIVIIGDDIKDSSGAIVISFDGAGSIDTMVFGSLDIETTGKIKSLADNQGLYTGASSDLRIYHDGSSSVIHNSTGSLYINAAGNLIITIPLDTLFDTAGKFKIRDTDDSSVTLFELDTTARTLDIGTAADPLAVDINTTTAVSSVLDEDNMASDSATALATQQSIKKYVDDNAGGLADVVDDATPQLGGDLDLNGKNIDFPTTANISDCLDEDNMASDSATKLCTQQSIKKYVDDNAGGGTDHYVEMIKRPFIYTDFHQYSALINDPYYGYSLVAGTTNAATATDMDPDVQFGACRLRSSASANSGYRWVSSATSNQLELGGNMGWDCIIHIDDTTNVKGYVGYHDASTATNPVDGMYMQFDGTTMSGYCSAAGSDTVTGTTYTFTVNTWYHLRGVMNGACTLATFYVYSMAGVELWTDTVNADIPGAGQVFGGSFLVFHSGTSAKDLCHVDYLAHWRNANTARGYIS